MPPIHVGPHRLDLKVRFCELDPYGHVNHSVYVQYFEAGRVEALDSVGMGLHVLQAELGLSVVVAEIQTRFMAAAMLGDMVVVESGISKVGRVKSTWLQRVSRDGVVLATQRMVSGCLGVEGRPTRAPAALVEALEVFRVDDDWL